MVCKVDINTERIIAEHILRYAGSILESNYYLIDGFSKSDNKYKVIKKLLGSHELLFKEGIIHANYSMDVVCLQNSGVRAYSLTLESSTFTTYL